MITLNNMKKRDKKENSLGALESQVRLCEEQQVRRGEYFKEQLALYQKWKTENNVEGIKY